MVNNVDSDQNLIWVYTVCSGLSVPILRVITACFHGEIKEKYPYFLVPGAIVLFLLKTFVALYL